MQNTHTHTQTQGEDIPIQGALRPLHCWWQPPNEQGPTQSGTQIISRHGLCALSVMAWIEEGRRDLKREGRTKPPPSVLSPTPAPASLSLFSHSVHVCRIPTDRTKGLCQTHLICSVSWHCTPRPSQAVCVTMFVQPGVCVLWCGMDVSCLLTCRRALGSTRRCLPKKAKMPGTEW